MPRRLRSIAAVIALASCAWAPSAVAAPHVWNTYDAMGRPPPLTRLLQYEGARQGRTVTVDGRAMRVVVHPNEPDLLVQRTAGGAFLQGASDGISLGLAPGGLGEDAYRRAAEAVAGPAGCRVTDLRPLDGRVSWEASYDCPPGVDLRQGAGRPRR